MANRRVENRNVTCEATITRVSPTALEISKMPELLSVKNVVLFRIYQVGRIQILSQVWFICCARAVRGGLASAIEHTGSPADIFLMST